MKIENVLRYLLAICALNTSLINAQNEIQRLRIDFETPLGYTRHLLLGFTPDNAATDEFDYGYDGLNVDDFPDDLNWIIDDQRYVIQGVGEFNTSKCYPLGMFLLNSGDINISLNALENFNSEINVFIYDALLGTFDSINNSNYSKSLTSGDYMNRFYITFTNDITQINIDNNSLSINDIDFKRTNFKYVNSTDELIIDTNNNYHIKELSIFNYNAQELYSKQLLNVDRLALSMQSINTNTLIIKLVSDNNMVFYKQLIIKK